MTLAPNEREVIITRADDENVWHVHTDSSRAYGKKLLAIAKVLGAKITPQGEGFSFDLPHTVITARKPRKPTRRQLDALAQPRPPKSLDVAVPTEAKSGIVNYDRGALQTEVTEEEVRQ